MRRREFERLKERVYTDYYRMTGSMRAECCNVAIPAKAQQGLSSLVYFQIDGVSRSVDASGEAVSVYMGKLFNALYSARIPEISVVFTGTSGKLGVFIGVEDDYLNSIEVILNSWFPQIRIAEGDTPSAADLDRVVFKGSFPYWGYLKGNPTGPDREKPVNQIDSVICGMGELNWCIAIHAIREEREGGTYKRQQYWVKAMEEASELAHVSLSEREDDLTISTQNPFQLINQYIGKISHFVENLETGIACGEWCVTVNYGTTSQSGTNMLGGLLTSVFNGNDSEPEPIHTMIYSPYGLNGPNRSCRIHNGGVPELKHTEYHSVLEYPSYSTYLNSNELGILAAFPNHDTYGFSVYDRVDFDVERKCSGIEIGSILNGANKTGNVYSVSADTLNRHCLVIGLTGSGKTNTLKCLVRSLAVAGKPFMVIEPAKKEYWELYKLGIDDLRIYSVGSIADRAHKLCLNPFEPAVSTMPDGTKKRVPLQTHIDFVYSAFKASFIMYTPMPYVLETAIYRIYSECGWDIRTDTNKNGKDVWPTIEDLYWTIPIVVTEMGYDRRMQNDLIGSLTARINSLRVGAKGDTLNVARSFPADELFSRNTVVELEDIGDDDVKAFIISLLLCALLEYRRQQEDCQLEVRHLMLIEEAHRLLKNVQSGTGENADPRGAAVDFFCNLLAELRSKGQGFIIADQIPSKLAPDLIKNTNLKIVHRTVAEEERLLMGGAMHMTPSQVDSLASLQQGVAAVYSEGDNRPKLVKPPYAGAYTVRERKDLSRTDVLSALSGAGRDDFGIENNPDFVNLTENKKQLCMRCNSRCRRRPESILSRLDSKEAYQQFVKELDPARTGILTINNTVRRSREFLAEHLLVSGNRRQDENCFICCILETWELKHSVRDKFIEGYMKK